MSDQTIQELTNFFQNLSKGDTDKSNCPKQSNLSFDDAYNYYFQNITYRGLANQTKSFYKDKLTIFGKYLNQIKKRQFLETVTEAEIRFYLDSKYSKNSVYTLNCHARSLRAFFNYLERDGYLIANPSRNVRPKRVRREKIDYFTIDQMRKILTSFDLRVKSELRNLLLVMILFDTGVRNSELSRIKIEDINFVDRSIYIYATKTNTFRTVYYSKETERILNAYRREVLKGKEKGPLFLKFQSVCDEPKDEQITIENIGRVLRRKCIKLFGKDFKMNPHKFRHTFATYFVINDGDPFSLRELMGHTNLETTKIYVDMSPKDLKAKHTKHSILVNMEEQSGGQHGE